MSDFPKQIYVIEDENSDDIPATLIAHRELELVGEIGYEVDAAIYELKQEISVHTKVSTKKQKK